MRAQVLQVPRRAGGHVAAGPSASLKLAVFRSTGVPSMSASNPGPVRRFFRGAWRVVDVSRRVVLNLLFLLILSRSSSRFVRSGPPPLADKTALVLASTARSPSSARQPALDRARPGARRGGRRRCSCATCWPRSTPRPRTRRSRSARRSSSTRCEPTGFATLREIGRRDRPLQGQRQEGRRLGLELRPAPVLPRRACRRGLPASAGHGLRRRLRQPAQLLQGRARQARRHRQRRPRRHLQERGEPFIANEPSPARSRPTGCSVRRALEDLHRRGREAAQARRPARSCAASTRRRSASPRPAATPPSWRSPKAGRRLKTRDELRALMIARGAKDDDEKTFRQISLRRLPRPRQAARSPATRSASSSPRARSSTARRRPGTIGGLSTANLIRRRATTRT